MAGSAHGCNRKTQKNDVVWTFRFCFHFCLQAIMVFKVCQGDAEDNTEAYRSILGRSDFTRHQKLKMTIFLCVSRWRNWPSNLSCLSQVSPKHFFFFCKSTFPTHTFPKQNMLKQMASLPTIVPDVCFSRTCFDFNIRQQHVRS